jgi:hypothetical protein
MIGAEDSAFVGQLLDEYAIKGWRMGVAADGQMDTGVPPAMQVGEVNAEGWVEWRMLPSNVTEAEVAALENEFAVLFPPMIRAYLRARFQLFDQVRSRRYDQQILMTDTPAGKPLISLRRLMQSWRPLIDAGYVPFAQWGDGWGPMCFDAAQRRENGECPVVWMDHEALVPLGPKECQRREIVAPLVQPLYDSCREFLLDVFGRS